jgi:hypothetical protein
MGTNLFMFNPCFKQLRDTHLVASLFPDLDNEQEMRNVVTWALVYKPLLQLVPNHCNMALGKVKLTATRGARAHMEE